MHQGAQLIAQLHVQGNVAFRLEMQRQHWLTPAGQYTGTIIDVKSQYVSGLESPAVLGVCGRDRIVLQKSRILVSKGRAGAIPNSQQKRPQRPPGPARRDRPPQVQKQRRSPSADIVDTAGGGCGICYSVRGPCWGFCPLTFECQPCPISSECPRNRYLCTFPVAVRGNSFTNRYSCGHLKLGKRVRSQP